MKKYIPNLFTLGNLLCGTIALIFTAQYDFVNAAIAVFLGIIFDFLDGLLARVLKIQGTLGRYLDSLSDMVTSGVVPGIVMFCLLGMNLPEGDGYHLELDVSNFYKDIRLIGLILTLSACYRLAKFNVDVKPSGSFTGLPTPAMSLFVVSLPLIQKYTDILFLKELVTNNYVLIGITLVFSYLMNSGMDMFSLKFKNFKWEENIFKYLLILVSAVLLLTVGYMAIPLIILIYIFLSIIDNLKWS
ncbi:MAG: phosphatidylserine synthase [Flavobacteriaceae bacterium]|nr:MAG: phosphatidylserine synthase [Flavobacteriaceae bacterium]